MYKYIFLLFSLFFGFLAYICFGWHWTTLTLVWSMFISMGGIFCSVASIAFLAIQIIVWGILAFYRWY